MGNITSIKQYVLEFNPPSSGYADDVRYLPHALYEVVIANQP